MNIFQIYSIGHCQPRRWNAPIAGLQESPLDAGTGINPIYPHPSMPAKSNRCNVSGFRVGMLATHRTYNRYPRHLARADHAAPPCHHPPRLPLGAIIASRTKKAPSSWGLAPFGGLSHLVSALDCLHCGGGDIEPVSNPPNGLAFFQQCQNLVFVFVRRVLSDLTTELLAPGFGGCQAGKSSISNQIPFELGEASHYCQH